MNHLQTPYFLCTCIHKKTIVHTIMYVNRKRKIETIGTPRSYGNEFFHHDWCLQLGFCVHKLQAHFAVSTRNHIPHSHSHTHIKHINLLEVRISSCLIFCVNELTCLISEDSSRCFGAHQMLIIRWRTVEFFFYLEKTDWRYDNRLEVITLLTRKTSLSWKCIRKATIHRRTDI